MYETVGLPGFSLFCARYSEYKEVSKIDYLPIIPESPTKDDPDDEQNPDDYFAMSKNKARLQSYLSNKWSEDVGENSKLGSKHFYMGGTFEEETKSLVFSDGVLQPVSELESTYEEADLRMILYTLYSFENDGAERVVIYAYDTDVVVLCLYYAITHTGSW